MSAGTKVELRTTAEETIVRPLTQNFLLPAAPLSSWS
jgi:hypothetical protein